METREIIAKELKCISIGCLVSDGLLSTLKRVLSVSNGSWRTVLSTLSDLIDPTCCAVIPDEQEGYVFCSLCGAMIGEYGRPNYCHNCGARVVSSDGV